MGDAVWKHKNELEEIVESVFTAMLGLEVSSREEKCPVRSGCLTAAVYLTGNWNGAVLAQCFPPAVCRLAGRFLGTPPPEAVDNDVRDVLGELANMIAGNLKCTMSNGIKLSMPSVVDGCDYALRLCAGHPVSDLAFETEVGPFWLTLVEGPAE
ncbi:MAG TPA: chemotaxis protein CheX [Bryobacteraceae bacterium]|nr:chemotaxis protein CheX [Bryobacteraceae bacterium]